jgi:uncharacterized membrane protein (DUF106 family)
MDVLAQLVVWLNTVANALGKGLLFPIAWLPGWLSATLVAVVTGVLMLVVFKFTSHQRAIKRVRDDINANLLALKLFKDSARVAVEAQGRLLLDAAWLLLYALVPMAVMFVPALLILGQLSLWYQQRPLGVGKEAIVTMKLNGDANTSLPEVSLQPTSAVEITVPSAVHHSRDGVRMPSKREVWWKIKANENGTHRLVFQVGDQTVDKELAVGDGYMRVSAQRPGWVMMDALENPWEQPFRPDSAVQSIDIKYPERSSYISGTTWWMAYWFVVSLIAGFCFRRVLNVNV